MTLRKYVTRLFFLLALFTLSACAQSDVSKEASTATSSVQQQKTIKLIIESEGKSSKEDLVFTDGQTVMEILKQYHDVTETDGFITAIDQVSQDQSKGLYWFFEINGEMAPKAADQITLKQGDRVRFYQDIYK